MSLIKDRYIYGPAKHDYAQRTICYLSNRTEAWIDIKEDMLLDALLGKFSGNRSGWVTEE